jgi:hypothetical protein
MSPHASPPDEVTVLRPESKSRRKLPVNFNQHDLSLFSHELERVIPQTRLLQLNNVSVSAEGILFQGGKMLPESFAFPVNRASWKRRSVLKFFLTNYLFRKRRRFEKESVWAVDDWSAGYFHWLTDALTRLYVMRDRLDDYVLLLPWDYQAREFVRASLKLFGVKTVEFIKRDEVLQCRKLFMPTHTAPSGHYNEEIIRGVRSLLLEASGAGQSGKGERIYISRGRARKRRILNEEAVLDILAGFRFQTIYSEGLSFEQQVKIFSRARYLVSNHGAGLTNMLFMPQDAGVLELRHSTDSVNNCYFTLSSALDLNYFYQTCQSGYRDQDPHAAALVVDPETLRKNLKLLLQS